MSDNLESLVEPGAEPASNESVPEEVTDLKPPDQPTTEDIELPVPGNDPQIITMETHAHHLHKAPGHGWKHYLFEFLMLFLAVFAGFLAENYREQRVEMERARELAKNLYKEI